MDDELRRWAATWKQMEGLDMEIVRRAKSAYRTEAVRLLLEGLSTGVGVVMAVGYTAWLSRRELPVTVWVLVGLMWCAAVNAVVFVWYSARQRAKSRESISDTPQSLVSDLVRVHDRELRTWLNKWGLVSGGVLAVAGLALGTHFTIQAAAAGKLYWPGVAWGGLAFGALSLVALGVFGHRRVAFLRRELRSLRDVQRELDATERGGS